MGRQSVGANNSIHPLRLGVHVMVFLQPHSAALQHHDLILAVSLYTKRDELLTYDFAAPQRLTLRTYIQGGVFFCHPQHKRSVSML